MENPTFKKIKEFIASKRIFLAVIVGVVIVGVSVYGITSQKSIFTIKANNTKKFATLQDQIELDTDNDGLLDWEESLWGTDPKNPDSDADGITDGDEINARKDELGLSVDSNADLNETERFSREFFATIVSLRQQGLLNQTSITNLANTVGKEIAVSSSEDFYQENELSVNSSSDAKIAYAQDLADLFAQMERTANIGIEIEMVSELLNNKLSRSADLAKLGGKYKDFAEVALEISVPQSLKGEHLKLVNNLYNLGTSIEKLGEIVKNPILGLQGISEYTKYSEEFIQISESIRDKII